MTTGERLNEGLFSKVDDIGHEFISDPSTSFWLKEQIINVKNRDPLDALIDAEVLVSILKKRLESITEANTNIGTSL